MINKIKMLKREMKVCQGRGKLQDGRDERERNQVYDECFSLEKLEERKCHSETKKTKERTSLERDEQKVGRRYFRYLASNINSIVTYEPGLKKKRCRAKIRYGLSPY